MDLRNLITYLAKLETSRQFQGTSQIEDTQLFRIASQSYSHEDIHFICSRYRKLSINSLRTNKLSHVFTLSLLVLKIIYFLIAWKSYLLAQAWVTGPPYSSYTVGRSTVSLLFPWSMGFLKPWGYSMPEHLSNFASSFSGILYADRSG